MKVKRCPVCKTGTPKYMMYSIPGATNDPDGLYVLFKRLECRNCGATVPNLVMTVDDAVSYWNDINPKTGRRYVLEKTGEEIAFDVEEEPEATELTAALKGE